ncbi:MAG: hypothetical protein ABJC87_18450, partial [Roseobacter sp.]
NIDAQPYEVGVLSAIRFARVVAQDELTNLLGMGLTSWLTSLALVEFLKCVTTGLLDTLIGGFDLGFPVGFSVYYRSYYSWTPVIGTPYKYFDAQSEAPTTRITDGE